MINILMEVFGALTIRNGCRLNESISFAIQDRLHKIDLVISKAIVDNSLAPPSNHGEDIKIVSFSQKLKGRRLTLARLASAFSPNDIGSLSAAYRARKITRYQAYKDTLKAHLSSQ